MKSILVPTDFSTCSINAVHYAAELAKYLDAKIVLFHAFHTPVMITEVPDMLSFQEMKDMQIEDLEILAAELKSQHGETLVIETVCESGFAVDEIQIYQEANENDLIVMGMKNYGAFSEKVFGSLTTTLMYKSVCPILSIPENYIFKPIMNIALAADLDDPNPSMIFTEFVSFIKVFSANLHIINVSKNVLEMIESTHSAAEENYKNAFQKINYSTHHLKNETIAEGINQFIKSKGIDLVAMIPKKHSFWENLIHEPQTKKIAFHANIPVMALNVKI
jgi:nucleotide-binding universal stress UspA family protein